MTGPFAGRFGLDTGVLVRLDDQLAAAPKPSPVPRAKPQRDGQASAHRSRRTPPTGPRVPEATHAPHRAGARAARTTREVTIRPVDLVDYVAIAAEITGRNAATIAQLPNLSLAESALHAPFAGCGEHEFYPKFVDKAAVQLERLARNHPLPDGNQRAAWVTLRVFIEINDWTWRRTTRA